MTEVLDLAVLHRPGEKDRHVFRSERWSVDFLVGGRSLFELLGGQNRDLSGAFLTKRDKVFRRTNENAATRELFSEVAAGGIRLSLYVCPECGDLGCGALTCEAKRVGDKVVWCNFGSETGIAEYPSDFASYADVGPFEFDGHQYAEAIARAAKGKL
ncbi:MAG: hypothetical protein M0D54_01660 [Hyphomonadaceae bacterium JAD_PAG50586_4]|nr:MAG: hypothetical protein M0D54_01660 [Hyphomonadaceae bacterium JAD_PAG50586_4]